MLNCYEVRTVGIGLDRLNAMAALDVDKILTITADGHLMVIRIDSELPPAKFYEKVDSLSPGWAFSLIDRLGLETECQK